MIPSPPAPRKLKNFSELALSDLRRAALGIAEAGLEAVDTANVIKKNVRLENDVLQITDRHFPLKNTGDLVIIGVGKCSLEAGEALEDILGDRISAGIVMDVHPGTLKKIRTFAGTHPLPSEQNMAATKEIINLLEDRRENDLVIFVISGGGSTLLCQPVNHTCLEEAKIFTCLSAAGATIQELNIVRKHLSLARGGFLAKYAYPAISAVLVFSDVPGNDLEFVASGPTVKDTTTVADAEKIIAKYDLAKKCGLTTNILIETPKDDKYFEKVSNILLVSNNVALEAMADEAKRLGFELEIVTNIMAGEAREVGLEILSDLRTKKSKTALFYAGETTVSVKGSGRGGRNLELTLSALRKVEEGELILALASDGRDNGEFAGAICDKITKEAIEKAGFNIETELENNNSYPVFEKTGNYLLTGDTGSNVSDLIIALKD